MPPPAPTPNAPLLLTGERTVPDVAHETYWFQRHVIAYRLAAGHVDGARVLDAGCGEGYGLAMLRDVGAASVTGADLDAKAVAHATKRYAGGTIEVVRCELMDLPLIDDEIDVTVSFQVIEHLHDIPGYLASLRRVTRPGGTILIATPNRLTFTPDSDVPVNPFHTREFTAAELDDELTHAGYEVGGILGIHHGPRLRAIETFTRRTMADLVTAAPPDKWPAWLRLAVPRIRAEDFVVRRRDIDTCLDLLAVCRVPR